MHSSSLDFLQKRNVNVKYSVRLLPLQGKPDSNHPCFAIENTRSLWSRSQRAWAEHIYCVNLLKFNEFVILSVHMDIWNYGPFLTKRTFWRSTRCLRLAWQNIREAPRPLRLNKTHTRCCLVRQSIVLLAHQALLLTRFSFCVLQLKVSHSTSTAPEYPFWFLEGRLSSLEGGE